MNEKLLGRFGEEKAAEYLRKKRYQIVACNYRSRFGEIDLIIRKEKLTAFVEVKLRRDDKYMSACEVVDSKKQQKIRLTADQWISENGESETDEI